MTESILMPPSLCLDNRYSIETHSFTGIEFADNDNRAILTIPLMHVGPNKKGLYWTEKMLKEVVPLFQGITYRYDLQGKEGSSHTIKKLSSPHFDVGWTYEGNDGAWYDSKTKILWTKGEVTHPEVIEKLKRITTEGKREINYASMGIIVEEASCSICGHKFGEDGCDHERNKIYDGRKCYNVPTKCSKGLHVALTNDPADGEADIEKCIFQDLNSNTNTSSTVNFQDLNSNMTANLFENGSGTAGITTQQPMGNQMPNGMAPGYPQNVRPGPAPSPQEMLKTLAERIKTIEMNLGAQPTPEVINSNPNTMSQDNMGVTSQIDEQTPINSINPNPKEEPNKMMGQNKNTPTNENPKLKKATETQEIGNEAPTETIDPMVKIMEVLQQILAAVSGNTGVATQEAGKPNADELLATKKEVAKKVQDDIPTEHMTPEEAQKQKISAEESKNESNKTNEQYQQKPDMVATTADTTKPAEIANITKPVEIANITKPAEIADTSELKTVKAELADMTEKLKKAEAKPEFQESNVPEFGGSNASTGEIAVADMTADQRQKTFGDFGKYDAIFNGAESAKRYAR